MDDGMGCLIGIIVVLALVGFILYLIAMAAAIVVPIIAAIGVAWGGGAAVKNYFLSFKKNVVDSNKKPKKSV